MVGDNLLAVHGVKVHHEPRPLMARNIGRIAVAMDTPLQKKCRRLEKGASKTCKLQPSGAWFVDDVG